MERYDVAVHKTRLPSEEHTIIPGILDVQPRSFPRRKRMPISSFAGNGFKRQSRSPGLAGPTAGGSTIHRPHSRQATLYTASKAASQVHTPWSGQNNAYPIGPPRKPGRIPHAIAGRPTTLTPSISPNLGKRSQHQRLHRCAIDGFLAPPSEHLLPTRILHHHITLSLFRSQYFSL